ncbi:MAG: type III restriction-modification system endonuclease [Candidatus Kapabacteria bacterium]|nr:type III restriction-modification system endonuclease [Candidatus Kapabacteria bacterium]
MQGFNFEKDLNHQSQAVENTLAVFENIDYVPIFDVDKNHINPEFDITNKLYLKNISKVQDENGIDGKTASNSNIIDIMMETGTGKTYTYTKTIFELNKQFGIFKFIIVVPTLSIKAGTVDFLKSDSSREHFKEQYGKSIHLHIVESQNNNRSKKSYIPLAVTSFVESGNFEKNSIQVMVINAGMINSETMQTGFHKALFDKYSVPFDAIAAIKPFVIIDEPHKFAKDNKTWVNILKMEPQIILRYGATFPDKEIKQKNDPTKRNEKIIVKDYQNLIYQLTAVDSFNRNLVKGVIGHITKFDRGNNTLVKFIDSNGTEASFELTENNKRKVVLVAKNESMKRVHTEMTDLSIENLNKSTVVLSNGLEMKKGDKLNPFSYAQTLQEMMIQNAIKHHFEIEKKFLTRDVKIKPLTLFFIDNIEEYRNKEGCIRKTVEMLVKAEILSSLNTETNIFYKSYLEKTLQNLSLTHGGYFSKDNTEKDEVIEKEINEILHDKQSMLDLENPRRFIFSKWTLREGWDNPNVFQICKLRSSGSEISKLQEVGRGLRLPVNEYGNRVKDEQFYLNYFVDFTESDFVDKLVNEINEKSGAISIEEVPEKLNENMIKKICELYTTNEDDLIDKLVDKKVIRASHKFLDGGFDIIKNNYPRIFEGVNSNKIRKASDTRKKVIIRTEKYEELKVLWEKLNEKVILEYKFDNEEVFQKLFTDYLKDKNNHFVIEGVRERIAKVKIEDNKAIVNEEESAVNRTLTPISTMKYSDFLKELSKVLSINIKTLHKSIIVSGKNINQYLNASTIRIIKHEFDNYLMSKAFDKFSIEYQKVSNSIHPTKLTDEKGNVLKEIYASDVGVLISSEKVKEEYLFDSLYYDSELEKENIKANIEDVIVFTKIPKNSIRIPVAGGKSYSPDFAYVLKFKDGEQILHFIVETKNVESEELLRNEENYKIKHAEKFFDGKVKIKFKTQFHNDQMVDLINRIYAE